MASAALQQAVTNVEAAIQALTLNPKPTYSVGGRSYSWESLLSMLMDKHVVLLKALQNSDGPFEVVSVYMTD